MIKNLLFGMSLLLGSVLFINCGGTDDGFDLGDDDLIPVLPTANFVEGLSVTGDTTVASSVGVVRFRFQAQAGDFNLDSIFIYQNDVLAPSSTSGFSYDVNGASTSLSLSNPDEIDGDGSFIEYGIDLPTTSGTGTYKYEIYIQDKDGNNTLLGPINVTKTEELLSDAISFTAQRCGGTYDTLQLRNLGMTWFGQSATNVSLRKATNATKFVELSSTEVSSTTTVDDLETLIDGKADLGSSTSIFFPYSQSSSNDQTADKYIGTIVSNVYYLIHIEKTNTVVPNAACGTDITITANYKD